MSGSPEDAEPSLVASDPALTDESSGVTSIEYGIIAGILAAVVAAAATNLGTSLTTTWAKFTGYIVAH